MKTTVRFLAVLSLAAGFTGCATTCQKSCGGSSHTAASIPRQENRTVAEKVGGGLFWLGQSALFAAASDTAQTETPFPR